jgi:hypothetical protein
MRIPLRLLVRREHAPAHATSLAVRPPPLSQRAIDSRRAVDLPACFCQARHIMSAAEKQFSLARAARSANTSPTHTNMNIKTLKTLAEVAAIAIGCLLFSAASGAQEPAKSFEVQVKDKPLTFCNPLNINAGSERIGRLGEPVVVLFKGDYYLFAGGAGYYVSPNLREAMNNFG